MSKNRLVNIVPELQIQNYQEKNSQFLSFGIEELINKYDRLISVPHRTAYYQIVLITEGSGYFWIDSCKYSYRAKSLFTLAKGQIGLFNFDGNTKGFVVIFAEEYVYKYPSDIDWINNLKLFDSSCYPMFDLPENEFIELMNLHAKIEIEYKTKDDFAKEEILLNLLKTFLLVAERNKRANDDVDSNNDENIHCINEFRKALEENYRNTRSVNFYAAVLNITPRKLNQVISSHCGKPTKRVIEERIILESKRLLVHTDRTIKEIGSSLGFTDPTNFNKFFRKFSSTTPADFRCSIKQRCTINQL